MNNLPTTVIIGRINVGKSALFNRLTESNRAIVSKVQGTTRDYNIGQVSWRGKNFNLIDTGGVDIDILKQSIQSLADKSITKKMSRIKSIEKEVIIQTQRALEKAELILMVVDGKSGILPQDRELALVVKKMHKPTILACNKIDNQRLAYRKNEFFKLGLGNPFNVSAINGSGTGDLLDEMDKRLKRKPGRPKKIIRKKTLKIALIGKPNVGKSSLVNKILGEQRVIVSEIAQTTREPQDTEIEYKGETITLIDTAGLKKQGKIKPGFEKLIAGKTIKAIQKANIVLLITEAQKPLSNQDQRFAGLLKDYRKGIIIIGNKWDLLDERKQTIGKEMHEYYKKFFPAFSWAPLIFISAQTGKSVDKVLDTALEIQQEMKKRIKDSVLDKILKKILRKQKPMQAAGPSRPHIFKLTQTGSNPPEFTVKVGKKQSIHFSYIRFIENQLRENFGFLGTTIKINVTSGPDS